MLGGGPPKACPSDSSSNSSSLLDEAETGENLAKLRWLIGVEKKEDWEGRSRKLTLHCRSHKLGWKCEMEWLLNLSEEEDKGPTRSDCFIKQAINLMVEAFKNLKEEEMEPCQGRVEKRLEEEDKSGESESVNPGTSVSATETAGP